MTDTQVTWLTEEAHHRLKAELEELIAHRPVIAAEINDRREEGDLRENGGYHAAREEQGKAEARIRQLEDMLRKAQVGETPPDDGMVEPGMMVTVRFVGDTDTEEFLFGAREMADLHPELTVYSPQSPMGQAINGKHRGDEVDFQAPNGKVLRVEILDAVPFSG